jgi:putative tricarboxylic transport membrane protein
MRAFYRSRVLIVLAIVFSLGTGVAYGASKFPEKPVTIVVHAGPGSGSDMLARLVGAANEKYKFLPQPIVIENKPGGNAAVAMAYVAGKKKDPYYLLTTVCGPFIATPLTGNSPVNYKDFTPMCNLSLDDYMVFVNSNSKYKSIMDVVAASKANPESVKVGGAMLGAGDSINVFTIENAAGIKLKYVAFGGGGDAVVALLGGHVDLCLIQPCEAMELMKANKIRTLGVLPEKRLAGAPDVPTLKEQGVNVVGIGINRGLVAPGSIPEDARKVLEEALFKFSKTEEYKKFHKDNVITEAWMDGATYGKWLDERNARYTVLLRDMGLLKK